MVTEMDTLFTQPKNSTKLIACGIYASVIVGVLFSQHILDGLPILAEDHLTIASGAMVAPILNGTNLERSFVDKLTIEQRSAKFNAQIKKKYKNGVITDVDKGVKHIRLTRYYQGKPVKINIIEMNSSLNPNLELTPTLASESLGRKSTIRTIAKNNNSIVAINGTFFKPSTGVPLGTLMINKKMYTGPMYNRVAMGIFDNGYDMARVQLNANLMAGDTVVKVDNLNQPKTLSTQVIVYTREWGKKAPVTPKYGKQIAVADSKIVQASTDQLEIPENGFVVVGPASKLNQLTDKKEIKFDLKTIPEWNNVKHIIGGGPYLVKNGQAYVDISEQKLGSIGGRNPRSAIGYTADGDLIIVAVDGREKASIGMTLWELAGLMKSIGCINAMNLDGGGSTVLYVNGKVVNHPKVQGGIALSNAITLNKVNQVALDNHN